MRWKTIAMTLLGLMCLVSMLHTELARSSDSEQDDESSSEALTDQLRGKWMLESRTIEGVENDEPPDVSLEFKADETMELCSGIKLVRHVLYRINSTFTPVTIDESGLSQWTGVTRGILLLEHDRLTICTAAKGRPRPKYFASGKEPGYGSALAVYRRVSKR